tara:strand:- start:11060 stop:12664 length:1605 start_codon:yes stop_codon:yes gene_type:complete
MPGIRQGQTVVLGPWMGGVRYDKPTENTLPDELASTVNCRIGTAGQVEKRKGSASYNGESALETAVASPGDPVINTVTGCGQWVNASNVKYTFMFVKDEYYEHTGASDADWVNRRGSVTITADDVDGSNGYVWQWVNANGVLYALNGEDPPIKAAGGATITAWSALPSGVTTAAHIAHWDNRLWIANSSGSSAQKDRVYRSGAGNYESWEGNYDLGGPITALVAQDDSLAVHTESGIWVLSPTGTANTPYSIKPVTTQGGIGGRNTIALPDGTQMMVRRDGIYSWDGGEALEKKSQALDAGYWSKLRVSRQDNQHDGLEDGFAVYYPNENEVWFFFTDSSEPTTQVKFNSIIIYNILDDFWFGPYEDREINCAALIDNKPHGGTYTGKLLDLAVGDKDETDAIVASFQTSGHTEDDVVRKRWVYARCYFDEQGGDWQVQVQQASAGLVGGAPSVLSMGITEGVLGAFTLDADPLGAGFPNKPKVVYGDVRLQGYDAHTSLIVKNTDADEPFVFRNVHLAYKPLGQKRKRRVGVE